MPFLVNPRLATPREIPAYQGAQTDTVIQLANAAGQPAAGIFGSGATLSSAVWQGQNQQILAYPSVSWFTATTPVQTGYDQGQVLISPNFGDVALFDPGGEYLLQIYATTGSERTVAAECKFKVLASPGFVSPSPPDLITYDYCLSQLTGVTLSDDQIDLLPWLITAASDAWRLECNNLNFDLRSLVEWYTVENDGYCRLWQQPIQVVTRVQGIRQLALTVSNGSANVAQAYFSFTGYDGGYGANAKTATGIVLNSITSGVPATSTVLFTTDETISQLVTAINAVGGGWSAQVDTSWGSWACTELTGGFVAQGCAANAQPSGGALFYVLTDLADAQLLPRSPMLYVGQQQGGNVLAERWGPGGEQMFGSQGQVDLGLVRVSYQAGFATIPAEVQYWVAQIVKWKLELNIQELLLKSEMAAEYKYDLADDMVHNLPRTVREAAGRWKQHFA